MTEVTEADAQKTDNEAAYSRTEIDGLKALIAKVTDNPAKLEFPTDRWGFTSAIKKEVLKGAGSVRGHEDKHDLLLGTLMVLITHIKMRKDKDRKEKALRLARIIAAEDERMHRQHYSSPLKKETDNG